METYDSSSESFSWALSVDHEFVSARPNFTYPRHLSVFCLTTHRRRHPSNPIRSAALRIVLRQADERDHAINHDPHHRNDRIGEFG